MSRASSPALLLGLGLAFASAQAAQAQGLTVGAPFDVTPALGRGNQRWPAVASGGGVYLVVWQEGDALAGVTDVHLFGARVSADGAVLDPSGFPLCVVSGKKAYPAVGFDGTHFLVAWQDFRSGRDWDVYATRVSLAGEVMSPGGEAVAAAPGNQIYPSVAGASGAALIVWSDLRPEPMRPESYGLRGTIVREGVIATVGGRLLAANVDASGGARSLLDPQARHDGSSYVVTARSTPGGWGRALPFLLRVTNDGQAQPYAGGFLARGDAALATDPQSQGTFVFGTGQFEHGSYSMKYLASHLSAAGEAHHLVLGLQPIYGPANTLKTAAVHDGVGFVAVVEQSSHPNRDERLAHRAVNVDLVALRFDSARGAPVDAASVPVPAGGWRDLRPYSGEGPPPIRAAADPAVSERHPALASAGEGRSLLVYSRRGGPEQYKLYGVVLSQ